MFNISMETCADCFHCKVVENKARCAQNQWRHNATRYDTARMAACGLFESMDE
jgi:hypothetical protein